MTIQIRQITPQIWELVWPEMISEAILMDMLRIKNHLQRLPGYELRLGYHVLSIRMRNGTHPLTIEVLENVLQEASQNRELPDRRKWWIPVCYDTSFAKDIQDFARAKNMSVDDLIEIHTKPDYLLHFYGFLPGFMYLGGLPEVLYHPRKAFPDARVAKGSVAIGGAQTGIYPQDSPGGWHVIGITPFKFPIDRLGMLPPFSPGDLIRFEPIDLLTYSQLASMPDYQPAYEPI